MQPSVSIGFSAVGDGVLLDSSSDAARAKTALVGDSVTPLGDLANLCLAAAMASADARIRAADQCLAKHDVLGNGHDFTARDMFSLSF